MKNTKAIFLIVLGSFIMATGFAFAETLPLGERENIPLGEAQSWLKVNSGIATGLASGSNTPTPPAVGAPDAASAPAAASTPAAKPPEVKPAEPEKPPTFGESLKKHLKTNMATYGMVAIGAFVGIALFGGIVGAMTGGLFMFALMFLGGL